MKSKRNNNESYWEKFVEAFSVSVLILDLDGNVLYANNSAYNLLKRKQNDLLNINFLFPVKNISNHEIELLTPGNKIVMAEFSIQPGKWKDKDVFIATLHDITQRKAYENKLKISASVFKYAKEGIIIADPESVIIDVNNEFCNITGYSKNEVIGKNVNILKSGKQDKTFYKKMWEHIKKNGYWYGKIWNRKKSGELYPQFLAISEVRDENDEIINYVGVFYDISEQEAQKIKLQQMAYYDSLTNLPNRVLFIDRLEQAMLRTIRSRKTIGLVFIDLDDFKKINDQYGHQLGDLCLQSFAKIIQKNIREQDTLSRYGGDEFLLLIQDISDIDIFYQIINRIYKEIEHPILVQNHSITFSVSMGVTFYPQDENTTPEQLVRKADQAMYKSKISGKNRITTFDVGYELLQKQDSIIINRLRQALVKNQFKLYYQPIVNMKTHTLIAVEGLIRWEHPIRGLLYPNMFIDQIKHDKFLLELTEWTIVTALNQLNIWRKKGFNTSISVNIDAMQLEQKDFLDVLKKLLAPFPKGIQKSLKFEILESSIIANVTSIQKVIKECIKMGIMFALDDFGSGFSSISHLAALPFKYVKIDMNFIKNILNNERDIQILKAMLDIAKAVKIDVIAEGVETQKHEDLLLNLECKFGQGFNFSKALPPDKFIVWYKNWKK